MTDFLFAIQSLLKISMKSPFKKILVSSYQSNFGYMIYFYYKLFDRAKQPNTYARKSRRLSSWLLCFFVFF